MPPAASEISRDELLGVLRREGLRVSRHQLLRWHDAGLLPQPRRRGLGRGKGTASYYPGSALLQARTLARLLAKRRSFVEAGWGLWAIGFPVTAWARDLLLSGLEAQHRELMQAERELRRGKGPLARAGSQRRAPRGLEQMRRGLRPETMSRVLQMLAAYPLGMLQAEDYSEAEWANFQDAVLREHWPAFLDDPGLPRASDVATGMAKLSRERSFPRVIAALKATPDARLEQYRNERQWLTEIFSSPDERSTALMSQDDFITFFKTRHMDPEGDRAFKDLMRSLGFRQAPPSPLQRWLAAARQVSRAESSRHP
jgi:hypothetical protein